MVTGEQQRRLTWALLLACLEAGTSLGAAQLYGWNPTQDIRWKAKADNGARVWSSPMVTNTRPWQELVVSWNMTGEASIKVDARAFHQGQWTRYYSLGDWTLRSGGKRTSNGPQRDDEGHVATDTLVMKVPADGFQVRITQDGEVGTLHFVSVSVADAVAKIEPLHPLPPKRLPVPEKSQAEFPEGIEKWCSPTTTAMLLDYWATRQNRPDWRHTVPETAAAVFDPGWPGTGNWPFNTAFIGSHTGLRACVARAHSPADLTAWLAAGYPLGVSVSLALLNGEAKPTVGDGHLVVVCGGTADGKVIIADPGRALVRVHREIAADVFVRAWAYSASTAYLVWPEDRIPPDWAGAHF